MLLQLLRDPSTETKARLDSIRAEWHLSTPREALGPLVAKDGAKLGPKTLFLIVDGLYHISRVFGKDKLSDTMTKLGEFA